MLQQCLSTAPLPSLAPTAALLCHWGCPNSASHTGGTDSQGSNGSYRDGLRSSLAIKAMKSVWLQECAGIWSVFRLVERSLLLKVLAVHPAGQLCTSGCCDLSDILFITMTLNQPEKCFKILNPSSLIFGMVSSFKIGIFPSLMTSLYYGVSYLSF